VSERIIRGTGATRGLVWTATACITVSLLVMIAVAIAGPSVTVPAMAHAPTGAPPWWVSLGLPGSVVLFTMWGTAVVAAVGVGAGLLAVARGARPPVRPLLVASFIVIAAFAFTPAAGTTDTQSYAIDGNMVTTGHSPYVFTPAQMVTLGDTLAVGSPPTWQSALSDYGPIATGEEWAGAALGGHSMAMITFWLKLFVALVFGAIALLFDRLLRDDPAMRLRAHLLWSLNPLLLWEIVASGHIDGIAAAFGVAGLAMLRFAPAKALDPAKDIGAKDIGAKVTGAKVTGAKDMGYAMPTLVRCVAAGALLGAAAATKSPYALFLVGALWAVRRSLPRIACVLGGWLVVTVTSYAIAGMPAVKVLFARGNQVTWDNLYQVFYRPFGLAGPLSSDLVPGFVFPLALALFIGVAVLVFFRLPDRVPLRPAVTPALAVSLAWIFFWPFQRPWYDVMIIALLVLYPSSRFDAVVLVRLGFAAVTYMEAAHVWPDVWYQHEQWFEGDWITAIGRLVTAAALIWMCVRGRWGGTPDRPAPAPGASVLQPQS
jgi:hypothetical protein